MSIAQTAKNFHAEKRGNCAMSVAYGYARETGCTEEQALQKAEEFRNYGGGRAPDGLCGALYAAKTLCPEKAQDIENIYKNGAQNFTRCKEIRPQGIIPCNRCVELAGEALDTVKG